MFCMVLCFTQSCRTTITLCKFNKTIKGISMQNLQQPFCIQIKIICIVFVVVFSKPWTPCIIAKLFLKVSWLFVHQYIQPNRWRLKIITSCRYRENNENAFRCFIFIFKLHYFPVCKLGICIIVIHIKGVPNMNTNGVVLTPRFVYTL